MVRCVCKDFTCSESGLEGYRHTRCLQLCDRNASFGSVRCDGAYGVCTGAAYGECWSSYMWSVSLQSGTSYWASGLLDGVLRLDAACYIGYCPYTYAFSVRFSACTREFSLLVLCLIDSIFFKPSSIPSATVKDFV